jgi:chromosome segregation ATPase
LTEKQQLIDSLLATKTENERLITDMQAELKDMTVEQERLIEEVVDKQEEIDALMSELQGRKADAESLAKAIEDAEAANAALKNKLEELQLSLSEKDLIIIDLESKAEACTAHINSLKAGRPTRP